MKDILAVREYEVKDKPGEKRSVWTKIGRALENRDGSWTLFFDLFPTEFTATKIQVREQLKEEKKEEKAPF